MGEINDIFDVLKIIGAICCGGPILVMVVIILAGGNFDSFGGGPDVKNP
jgi:hypothetical protein